MSELGRLIKLEYGVALLAEFRTGHGFPVFGSNGEVGRHSKCLVEGPGIIVGRKGSVGKVSWSSESFWPIDTTYFVSATKEKLKWLYWILYWLPLERLDTSTGVPGLNRNDVYSLSVFEPSDDEKRIVANILDTLDTTIRQTEAIIAKLQQVKQGLLHDLLTRGIYANGQLRPPVEQAPHLYKESPLGWIPREWEVVTLAGLANNLDGQRIPIKESERQIGDYPYYGASGIIDWVNSYLFNGDYVLLGEDGENVVSRRLPLAFRATGKIWVNNHAHIYEPKPGVDIAFLCRLWNF